MRHITVAAVLIAYVFAALLTGIRQPGPHTATQDVALVPPATSRAVTTADTSSHVTYRTQRRKASTERPARARSAPQRSTQAKSTQAGSGQAGSGQGGFGQGKEAATAGTKVVSYDGYTIRVPSSWPVYRLVDDPHRCVRYDVHAVYLGTPGTDQDCPPRLVGRTQTVSITATGVSSSSSGASPTTNGPAVTGNGTDGTRRHATRRDSTAHQQKARRTAAHRASGRRDNERQARLTAFQPASTGTPQGRLVLQPQQDQYQVTMANRAVSVTATYGNDPAQVAGIVRSMQRVSGASSAPAVSSAPATVQPAKVGFPVDEFGNALPSSQGAAASATPSTTVTPTPSASSTASGKPATSATPGATPTSTNAPARPADVPSSPVNGFDTCTAPSLATMKAWRASYSVVGVYIGGQDMACDYGNLSASWISSTAQMGWSTLPIYVGLQAPCTSFNGRITSGDAATEGQQAATAAVADASRFGVDKGAPIYYDMEAYDNSKSGCTTAVLTFLNAWTNELHAKGYVAGVYSSAASGISDLASASSVDGHSFTGPDALWFALWDGQDNLVGRPYLSASQWAADRSKQYQGSENKTVGGYTLSIDADRVDSAVAK